MVRKFNFNWNEKKKQILEDEKKEGERRSYGDDRFWKLEIDKETKKGSAIIRFLPDEEGTPYIKYFAHFFQYVDAQGNRQYYVDKCATTVGKSCPVCDKNKQLFDSPYDSDNDVGRDRKRRIHYVSNVKIVKDPAHPEFDGKVKLFDYGPQIFKIYRDKMFGKVLTEEEIADAEKLGVKIEEEVTFVPCDFDEGAEFFLRSTLKETVGKQKWNTYENSVFQPQSALFADLTADERDDAIEELMEQTHSLSDWEKPQNYPNDIDVKTKLADILGQEIAGPEGLTDSDLNDDIPFDNKPEKFVVKDVEPEQPDDSVEDSTSDQDLIDELMADSQ